MIFLLIPSSEQLCQSKTLGSIINISQHIFYIPPVLVAHIIHILRIINVQLLIAVTNKSPIQIIFFRIGFKSIKFIANLHINIFTMSCLFSTFCFDNPITSILHVNNMPYPFPPYSLYRKKVFI